MQGDPPGDDRLVPPLGGATSPSAAFTWPTCSTFHGLGQSGRQLFRRLQRSRQVPRCLSPSLADPPSETGTDDALQERDCERCAAPNIGMLQFPRTLCPALMAPRGSAKKSPPSHVDIVPRAWNLGSGLGSCVTGRDETRLEHVYTGFPPARPHGPVDRSSRYPPFFPLRLRLTSASLLNEADHHHNEW